MIRSLFVWYEPHEKSIPNIFNGCCAWRWSDSATQCGVSRISAEVSLVCNYRTLGLRTVNPEGLPSTILTPSPFFFFFFGYPSPKFRSESNPHPPPIFRQKPPYHHHHHHPCPPPLLKLQITQMSKRIPKHPFIAHTRFDVQLRYFIPVWQNSWT